MEIGPREVKTGFVYSDIHDRVINGTRYRFIVVKFDGSIEVLRWYGGENSTSFNSGFRIIHWFAGKKDI